MFRIVCDCMRSGSIELYLTEIIRSGLQMFVVCLVGVRQRNFEPVVCVYGPTDALIIQIYSVIKLYMFRASSLPIIRNFLLYIRHW